MDGDLWMRALYIGLLLAALSGWAMVEMRKGAGRTGRMALAWGMIFLGVVALYGLWGDIRRGIRPGQEEGAASVVLPRAEDGHYYATLTIAGVDVQFMADTGATEIVLNARDAARLGITGEGLAYTGTAMTANGMVQTARVTLRDVSFGPFSDAEIPAAVTTGEMDISLLGMSYLGLFDISIAGERMELRR
ncbi:retropepsin-like aspartic protease family protein [Stagnihabitans tardus]|uniref:TIGR02281 family clan AA aspartic protease n=1 Tax=Stagnihabitans tardus TaxID=2699202 RepID=A0AAE4Y7N7_9RHOB|nr:TIGR02281 family clan AA aspartic protease [Stagnihabitans tardus]NBZ87432.1 TIGR02281 family clan AA aspartic protease [Stagnihabitans tardus]